MAAAVDRVRENRLRRKAERQGLRLVRSRRRDPHASGYGKYLLEEDAAMNARKVFGYDERGECAATLDQIEAYLTGERP